MPTSRQFLALILTLLCSPAALAYLPTANEDYYRVIALNGSDIAPAVGMEIDKLSLFAVYEGNLEPIPYQIDEYNVGGAVYFEEWDEPLEGIRNIMDPNDKLLMLMGDSGPRRTAGMPVDGDIVAEIELQTSEGTRRYAYLVSGSRLRADAQHVRYSIEESRVETDFYTMVFDKENQLIWKDFKYADFEGESPIDGLKIGFETGILTSGASVEYDNNNFVARTVAENVGPIRTTAQLHLSFILLGMDFIDVSIQLHFYPNGLVYDVRLVLPETRRAMLADPKLSLTIDFNKLIGAHGITDFLDEVLQVDGEMSERELAAVGKSFSPQQSGLLLKSNRDFDVLVFLDWVSEATLPMSLAYRDNLTHQGKMDRFQGQVPDAGYRLTDFPESGLLAFVASIYFSDNFNDKPAVLSRYVRSSPAIRINY